MIQVGLQKLGIKYELGDFEESKDIEICIDKNGAMSPMKADEEEAEFRKRIGTVSFLSGRVCESGIDEACCLEINHRFNTGFLEGKPLSFRDVEEVVKELCKASISKLGITYESEDLKKDGSIDENSEVFIDDAGKMAVMQDGVTEGRRLIRRVDTANFLWSKISGTEAGIHNPQNLMGNVINKVRGGEGIRYADIVELSFSLGDSNITTSIPKQERSDVLEPEMRLESLLGDSQHQAVKRTEKVLVSPATEECEGYSELKADSWSPQESIQPSAGSTELDGASRLTGQGAIPKKVVKTQQLKVASFEKKTSGVENQTEYTKLLIKNIKEAHDEFDKRRKAMDKLIECPTGENAKEELNAALQGFWTARELSGKLERASSHEQIILCIFDEGTTPEVGPISNKYQELLDKGVLINGCSPCFIKDGQEEPCFDLNMTQNGTVFVLREGCPPATALDACFTKPFVAKLNCFSQLIEYKTLLDFWGEEFFNWHFSKEESKLTLLPDEVFSKDGCYRNPLSDFKEKIPQKGTFSRNLLGHKACWGVSSVNVDDNCQHSRNVLYSICTKHEKKSPLHTIPGLIKDVTVAGLKQAIAEHLGGDLKIRTPGTVLNDQRMSSVRYDFQKIRGVRRDYLKHLRAQQEQERIEAQSVYKKPRRSIHKTPRGKDSGKRTSPTRLSPARGMVKLLEGDGVEKKDIKSQIEKTMDKLKKLQKNI